MTQAEMEAEIVRLQERLSRVEHAQGAPAGDRVKLAQQCKIIGIAFAAAGALFAVAQFGVAAKLTSPLGLPFILTAIAMGLPARSFQLVPNR